VAGVGTEADDCAALGCPVAGVALSPLDLPLAEDGVDEGELMRPARVAIS
jgi:hypothetical protein